MLSQEVTSVLTDSDFNHKLSELKDGFFIQIGANDGVSYDPIHKSVVEYGLSGILVEPGIEAFNALKINYQNCSNLFFENCAIAKHNGKVNLYCGTTTPHFTLDKNKAIHMFDVEPTVSIVDSMTIGSLVSKYNPSRIDLLQIDAEGLDYVIIEDFDFNLYTPSIVRFERVCMDSTLLENCLNKLKRYNYVFYNSEDNSDIIAILHNQ